MDKEVVVHIYNRILLSQRKGQIWVSWTELDEPRAFSEWSKSEREKQMHTLTHIYMESRKMVLMNLVYRAGRETETYRTDFWTQQRKERVGWIERVELKHYCVWNRQLLYYITQGAQPHALWQPREVGWGSQDRGSRGREYVYTYGWIILLYGRNQHNTVKQLSSN